MRHILTIVLLSLSAQLAQAQITIGGNVYGAGNAGDLGGKTTVTVRSGNIEGSVFGGARQANVGGSAFVHIDGEHQSGDITISRVYGGNDISGTIGTSATVPTELAHTADYDIDATYNAFVLTTPQRESSDPAVESKYVFIGQLFGGGNGDYDYESAESPYKGLALPKVDKTYQELRGGTYGYVYAGGNNATVEQAANICIDNGDTPMTSNSHVTLPDDIDLTHLDTELAKPDNQKLMDMGINLTTWGLGYNFRRIFGGNNKAAMHIRPTWHLLRGKVYNLYSGGNEGNMTSKDGILLEIGETSHVEVENLFGGCRKADVLPLDDEGNPVDVVPNIEPYKFPLGLSARVLVRGGTVTNVYGGNDISGSVTGGNAVGVYTSIKGDLYGGGNGSYAYTDNAKFQDDVLWGDFYYDPSVAASSADALFLHRPNAEQVSIRVFGSEDKPTIIHGSIYLGGNSATISTTRANPMVELKIGSHVIADNVFLGNNGVNMVDATEGGVLWQYQQQLHYQDGEAMSAEAVPFSQMDLTDETTFAKYMEGCAMEVLPTVVFDSEANGDPATYIDHSSYVGSFYCGGNVGSILQHGCEPIDFSHRIVIFEKLVGGCNNANVLRSPYNANYFGGLIGDPDASGRKLQLDLEGLLIQPKRWAMEADGTTYKLNTYGNPYLEWNTVSAETGLPVSFDASTAATGASSAADEDRRLAGGHIYGGCYQSGHVNGNVVINVNGTIIDRDEVFDDVELDATTGEEKVDADGHYNITRRNSGVILRAQGEDTLGGALSLFGGGYGAGSEIWGSTTVNLNQGYVFQVFGGGEEGAIGKGTWNETTHAFDYPNTADERYSTYINLRGPVKGVARGTAGDSPDMAEAEYVYGGGYEGPIIGSTHVNLGNGRLFNSFGGSCNADILGHTETYVGRNTHGDDSDHGYPYIREHIYGGNDLGGHIRGIANFADRVSATASGKVYNPLRSSVVLDATSYMEYQQGHVANIYGGHYGAYDYKDRHYDDYTDADGHPINGFKKPFLHNAFVNFRPNTTGSNAVARVYGGSQGYHREENNNKMQNRSYVLVDIPQTLTNFAAMEVFGSGDYAGIGIAVNKDVANVNSDGLTAAAVIDLVRGRIKAAYGGSFREGTTRRTIVNVPVGSTIYAENLFAGAYGLTSDVACDVYEGTLNYSSADATVTGALYGGNNNNCRTLYGTVNVNSPVWSNKSNGYMATVYGAGYGPDTWSRNTTVNLNDGAQVYEVYGGGLGGRVLNDVSVAKWKTQAEAAGATVHTDLDGGYTNAELEELYAHENPLGTKTNTNVYINKGATVLNYSYGGGLGSEAVISGTTYIGLHGGTVRKDIYAGGTSGAVEDKYGAGGFTAGTNAFVEGGSVRNVYGGGWEGAVGHHVGGIGATTEGDILGTTNVVIGIRPKFGLGIDGYGFYKGVPAVQRNAYAGGEGGAVWGTASITLNNGYIGYVYNADATDNPATAIDERYEEKLHDETWTDHIGENRLEGSGNVFGGGYIDNSSVDFTQVTMYGGYIRNSLFGGGEIAAIGRGTVTMGGYMNSERTYQGTHKAGKTHVEMYNGHVKRDVFGGGKGYDNLGRVGTLYSDGYVFGQTEVHIRGGEIGTVENVNNGYGNVFGGGDIGYVYGIGTKDVDGPYPSPNHYYYYLEGQSGKWSEDCKVVVEPYAQVMADGGVTIDGVLYPQYSYVPTDALNKLKGKNDVEDAAKWAALDDRGITIRNAIFAGGNVDEGSDKIYANTVTVFGNVTATVRDVYRRDLITIGTEHTGGLYGGGNLSLVDGYRELHVANYGTDYYGLQQEITYEDYLNKLTDRERAYFRLRYTCLRAFDGGKDDLGISYNGHNVGDQIYEDEFMDLPDEYQTVGEAGSGAYWKLDGVCSIYAGRLLNTLQRADLAGIYGSRLVLQGARDRVTDVVDYTRYTINRIGELSLMKVDSPAGETDDTNKSHGNYFGIYSVVNYLGNLTSDVRMTDTRTSNTADVTPAKTYHDWKYENRYSRKRNTATCHNQVALASGVFLELTTEMSTAEHKDYGYITGVVELDLINAKADAVGGGYVYAKNEHGARQVVANPDHVTLSNYNATTRTYKMYEYDQNNLEEIQTSGNFIHDSRKIIIDDCYPRNLEYRPGTPNYSEAHYWYIKGSIYIYDQVVSAYTGSPTAYTREQNIPLTITAGSHGQLKLVNVKPNLYAYYSDAAQTAQIGEDGVKVNNGAETFMLNDVISYWDWSQLSTDEQKFFVEKTMVTVAPCTYTTTGGTSGSFAEGAVLLPDDDNRPVAERAFNYKDFKKTLPTKEIDGVPNVPYVHDTEKDLDVAADDVFRPSNNLSHNTGYVVSFEMDTPSDWNTWYSPISRTSGGGKIDTPTYGDMSVSDKADYLPGPTFSTTEGGVYGQRWYTDGEIVPEEVVSNYSSAGTGTQAVVTRAYVTSEQVTYTYNGQTKSVNPGTAIGQTEYDDLDDATKERFAEAYVCTNTLRLNDENYILYGELVNNTQVEALAEAFKGDGTAEAKKTEILNSLTDAHIVETAGMYGGTSYASNTNYSALEGWASLSAADRASNRFKFNGDAFDVLSDPDYEGLPSKYGHPYDETKDVEYVAIYNGENTALTYKKDGDANPASHSLTKGDELSREEYVSLANEKYHYTPIHVSNTSAEGDHYYIAKKDFARGNVPYAKGQVISSGTYRSLSAAERTEFVEVLTLTNTSSEDKTYFYCREDYMGDTSVTNRRNGSGVVADGTSNGSGTEVQAGWVITKEDYAKLKNDQKDFTIKGNEPTEKTTLYVSRESDIFDLSKEKIISVIYQYTYNEGSEDGDNVELVNELHIINIHLQFESGAPLVDPLQPPAIVLPGSTVGLKQPNVTPGAYELIGGGWEIFDNKSDAEHHRNGTEYSNNKTPMYWYQNERYWVAYYAKSYLGKTYSNPVPFAVANYHDLDQVMQDKEHHMYVDHPGVVRNSKIYIDDRACLSDPTKNELDLLKDFYDLSLLTTPAASGTLEGHAVLDTHVKGGDDLDFILRSDMQPKKYTSWTPIGNSTCFGGTLHGDGYTISGLDHSLFDKLCGSVYNLGVTGSFTEAGIANEGEGYIENCWIKSSASGGFSGKEAVLGNRTGVDHQVVNCYYPESHGYAAGQATPMPEKAFNNGTVAYNLNGFYLNKRYYDHEGASGRNYSYIAAAANGSLPASELASEAFSTGHYPVVDATLAQYGNIGYVESRYENEDFIYAAGVIPENIEERQRSSVDGSGATVFSYAPIWPDDYLFFGQMLTYGYSQVRAFEEQPTHLVKTDKGRLLLSDKSNRVYRAPAYFQSKVMDVAHYNPWAIFPAKTSDGTDDVYPGLTALDFTGYGDTSWTRGMDGNRFYRPLLDDAGLTGIETHDQTQNLLIYTVAAADTPATNGEVTASVVADYLDDEPVYSETDGTYRTVAPQDASHVHGHWVQKDGSDYVAKTDHLLVDRQDFNAPISYQFASGKRMWYQRTPDRYVDRSKGWETVSVPFTAELVTTNEKGELTHFYSKSRTVEDGTTKVGHEYWLREYNKMKPSTGSVLTAVFDYPTAAGAGKTVDNTFLWDHYYSHSTQKDANTDTYQTYYAKPRTYEQYPRLANGTPYIVGFPGKTFYEFDLSGEWTPKHTALPVPDAVGRQTITLASAEGATIGVSDDELTVVTKDSYSFRPNYLSKEVVGYLMNAAGDSFVKTDVATAAVPFRPYFVAAGGGAREHGADTIVFDDEGSSFAIGDPDPTEGEVGEGCLTFFTRRHLIGVTSSLRAEADVLIVNTAGITLASFTIAPGETIETDIPVAGVYIVRAANGRYVKKLVVK